MELSEAIEILKSHNKWRRCREDINQYEMVDPKKLGEAIDTVIGHYELPST